MFHFVNITSSQNIDQNFFNEAFIEKKTEKTIQYEDLKVDYADKNERRKDLIFLRVHLKGQQYLLIFNVEPFQQIGQLKINDHDFYTFITKDLLVFCEFESSKFYSLRSSSFLKLLNHQEYQYYFWPLMINKEFGAFNSSSQRFLRYKFPKNEDKLVMEEFTTKRIGSAAEEEFQYISNLDIHKNLFVMNNKDILLIVQIKFQNNVARIKKVRALRQSLLYRSSNKDYLAVRTSELSFNALINVKKQSYVRYSKSQNNSDSFFTMFRKHCPWLQLKSKMSVTNIYNNEDHELFTLPYQLQFYAIFKNHDKKQLFPREEDQVEPTFYAFVQQQKGKELTRHKFKVVL